MKVSHTGIYTGRARAGQVLELPAGVAEILVERGVAEYVFSPDTEVKHGTAIRDLRRPGPGRL
jgi:hypothetical protein